MASRASARDLETPLNPTEARIIDAARRCFSTAGIDTARLDGIATDAGVSRQTIYKYFNGKRDIADQIAFLEMNRINATLRQRLHTESRFAERLTEAIVLSVEIALDNPYISRAIADFGLLPGLGGTNPRILDWQRRQWRPLLDRAAATGELAQDITFEAVLAWIIHCQLLLSLTHRQFVATGMDTRGYVRRFMVQPLLDDARREQAGAESGAGALRAENASLRALVADQALEIFRLRG